MKKLKEASEKEKKQEREDQKNHYQEALPHVPFQLALYIQHIQLSYAQHRIPSVVQHSFSVFQPPRVRA
ncbi:hypothetical protein HH214_18280 [Mucilaginibacter robiniae]|uniref:Uncharacterized protein n=1 Tax=Mucilaginibacter robiniae TaxID=2728022 RepID=A0A7L5E3S7_9SPHI|nr:hypothetical protein [Mucilaginibacter robiniae]QJD97681.1 hypothetical protein HH214_18280 [Mucilaginibacter robiniae]